MILKPRTLRGQLSLMIAIMGGIGLFCSIFIVNIFVAQILEDQKSSTLELIKQESITQTEKHKNLLEEFGLRIQKNPELRHAFEKKNFTKVQALVNDEFYKYYVTARVLIVNKIYVFDKKFNLLTQSTKGENFGVTTPLCTQLTEQAKLRTRAERPKTLSSFCYHDKHAFYSVIVPISTLSPKGYLQIISNPENIFQHLENKLAMPLEITTTTGKISYKSKHWINVTDENLITIDHALTDINNNQAINILMQKDISKTRQTFMKSRTMIIIIVSIITLIAVFLFLLIFEKSMLRPLNILEKQFTLIKNDKKHFSTQLKLTGSPEIISLTKNFNGLSSKLEILYKELEEMAFTDQLTALPNRSRLHEILDFHVAQHKNNNIPFTLFMMDLDRFKTVNDTLGHHAGDLLLQQVSDRLQSVLRKSDYVSLISKNPNNFYGSDIVARLGGDEFATVLPATGDINDAENIARKIHRLMLEPFQIENHNFNVGVSIGIAVFPKHANTANQLMQHADVAMYQAKDNQKGYAVFSSSENSKNQKLLSLDADLRSAIQNDKLSLVYQPKINLKTNTIVGVEALLRWDHEEKGFIPPDKFIPMAERSNLINEVTDWVLRNSFQQKSQWVKNNIPLSLAINLSPINLLDRNLIQNIKSYLSKNQLTPESIYLELTETAVMADPSHAIIVMRQLYDMGVRISIDDFGTGYSSLSYLKQLPVDEIKIDRSFVIDMQKDTNDAIIVQSTIDLAHNMGLQVIAEGVENKATFTNLSERTCDLAQGNYMAEPMENAKLLKWLKDSPWGLNNSIKKAV